jgi:hypothetical protein
VLLHNPSTPLTQQHAQVTAQRSYMRPQHSILPSDQPPELTFNQDLFTNSIGFRKTQSAPTQIASTLPLQLCKAT